MTKKTLIFIGCILTFWCSAQRPTLKIDTVLKINFNSEFNDKPIAGLFANEVWIYKPSQKISDTLSFLKINLLTHLKKEIKVAVPSFYYKISNPVASCIAINEQFLSLLFFDKVLILKKSAAENLDYQDIVSFTFKMSSLYLNKDELLTTTCYNYHPKSSKEKVIVTKYNIPTEKVVFEKNLDFEMIELSHFSPNHWFEKMGNNLLFAQARTYSISAFNLSLSKIGSVNRPELPWVPVSQKIVDSLNGLPNDIGRKSFIVTLLPEIGKKNRLEAIYAISDSILLVSYIPINNKKNGYARKYDYWKLEPSSDSIIFKLLAKDINNVSLATSVIKTKKNYPVRLFSENIMAGNNRLLIFKEGSGLSKWGLTSEEYKKKENEYYSKNDPGYVLEVFKFKY